MSVASLTPAHATAIAALQAGLSTVPPKEDGSKAPLGNSEGKWKQYQQATASESEISGWYRNGRTGVGIVTGAVSGNLEVLDFDTRDMYGKYRDAAVAAGLLELVDRVAAGYSEVSPNGFHLPYKCPEISGNTKLAQRPADTPGEVKTLIETRGEGGYIIVAPTSGSVNPDGEYILKSGSFQQIVQITPAERLELHRLAQSFDEVPKKSSRPDAPQDDDGQRVGDDFNQSTTWPQVLEPHGWVQVYERDGTTYWRRPGKDTGISATTNHADSDLLYIFSTSTILDSERSYDRFGAHAFLNHGGDFKAAAKELHRERDRQNPRATYAGLKQDDDTPDNGFSFFSATTWQGRVIKPREWVWTDWLPRGYVTGLGGPPGSSKSTLAQVIATHIALGRDYCGAEVMQGQAIVIACEDDEDELHRRQDAINRAMGVEFRDLDNLTLTCRVGQESLLARLKDGAVERTDLFHILDRQLGGFDNPVFLFLDMVTDFWTGSEIMRQQVNSYVKQHLAYFAQQHRLALVTAYHPSLSGISSGTGTSGSTAWEGSFRSRLYLEPDEEDINLRKLKRMKANYSKKDEIELVWREGYLMPAATMPLSPKEQRQQLARDKFMQYFREHLGRDQVLAPSPNSPSYAPTLFEFYAQNHDPAHPKITKKQFANAMLYWQGNGVIKIALKDRRQRLVPGENASASY